MDHSSVPPPILVLMSVLKDRAACSGHGFSIEFQRERRGLQILILFSFNLFQDVSWVTAVPATAAKYSCVLAALPPIKKENRGSSKTLKTKHLYS